MGRLSDFLVIGAGIAGVATARHLARSGFSVELIEARRPAWGASGRNPGFLWLLTKPAGIAMEFATAGRRYAEGLSLELPDYGFRACGGLIVYRDEALADVAHPFAEDRQAAGLPARHVDGDEARRLCPSLSLHIKGAIWSPLEAHQDTRRLVALLAEEAIAAGRGYATTPGPRTSSRKQTAAWGFDLSTAARFAGQRPSSLPVHGRTNFWSPSAFAFR